MVTGLNTADVAVVGGGPSGLMAAIALATAGLETVLIAPPAPNDNRTTALLASSITALETLGVWHACRDNAAPLRKLRIIDDTGRLWRAPEACFDVDEIHLDAFAYNIRNRHLIAALEAVAAERPNLRIIASEAISIIPDEDAVSLRTADGNALSVKLVVGADGRNSASRDAAGIETRVRHYPQFALTYTVSHSRPHDDISTEFHTRAGPFTTVPLPGDQSSIVCVVDESDGGFLQTLSGDALDRELERRMHSILGKVKTEPEHGYFPLTIETASPIAANRIALIGEAAHRIPPIGAQGLNLGMRDAAAIADIAAEHAGDPGNPAALQQYDNLRRADIVSRTLAVDVLNRSLLSGILPMQGLRGLGLHVLNTLAPLRRAVMREGVTPRTAQPRLMRGELPHS